MCCRYDMDRSIELDEIVEEMNRSPLLARAEGDVVTYGEVFPSNVAPAIATNRAGRRAVFPMKWGFGMPGGRPIINARVETAAEKPSFREAFAAHRCALPTSGYFEWEHFPTASGKRRTGAKYRLRAAPRGLTWLAGLYRVENGFPCFVVLTRDAVEDIRFIHDRMPVILPEMLVSDWIDPQAAPGALLDQAITRLNFEKA